MKPALTLAIALAASAAGLSAANATGGAYPGTPEMTRLVHGHATPDFRQYYDAAMRARGHYIAPDDRVPRVKKRSIR